MAGGKKKKGGSSKKKKASGKKQSKGQGSANPAPRPVTREDVLAHPSEGVKVPQAITYSCWRFDVDAGWYKSGRPTPQFMNLQIWDTNPPRSFVKMSPAARMDIADRAQDLVNGIFDRWEALKSLITQSGGHISAVWATLSTQQRHDLMQKAWPAIPTRSCPDFAMRYLGRSGSGTRLDYGNSDARDMARAAYLLPGCNANDLGDLDDILEVVRPRIEHMPGEFALKDLYDMQVGLLVDGMDKADVEGAQPGVFIHVDGPELSRYEYGTMVTKEAMVGFAHWLSPPGLTNVSIAPAQDQPRARTSKSLRKPQPRQCCLCICA